MEKVRHDVAVWPTLGAGRLRNTTEQKQGLHIHAKFHLNVCFRLPKKTHFWQILTFGGLLYRTPVPLSMRANFDTLQQTRGIRLRTKFRLDRFILSHSGGENPQILSYFGLRHFVGSPVGGNLRKLNKNAQLQPSPTQRHQNRFCTPTPS